jgi:hypothetical protein
MTIMMSDSLRDIVSTGQLTGDISEATLNIDGEELRFDLYSFVSDKTSLRCLLFSTRESVVRAIKAKKLTCEVKFDNNVIGKGHVITVGYEPLMIGDTMHEMLLIHLKRDN